MDSELPTVAVFAQATEEDTPKAVVEASDDTIRSDVEQVRVFLQHTDLYTLTIVFNTYIHMSKIYRGRSIQVLQ